MVVGEGGGGGTPDSFIADPSERQKSSLAHGSSRCFVVCKGLIRAQTRLLNYQMQDISSLLTSSTGMIRFVNSLNEIALEWK